MAEPPDDAELRRRRERVEDIHHRNIAVAFANETFTIGMLQVVSLASLGGLLATWDPAATRYGRLPAVIFLTLMGVALITAVLAAYFKHQYKMWDVKTTASQSSGRMDEATKRSGLANCYLSAMRHTMRLSAFAIVLAVVWLLVVAWIRVLCPTSP